MYLSKQKDNEKFGRKMNEDVNGNRKLFWKELSNVKIGKVESCNTIKDGNGRLAQGEDEMIWKEYFEGLFNIDTQEQIAVNICGFDCIQRGNQFGGEPIGRTELKNGKAAGKDEITGEIMKGGGDRVMDWVWKLCNMTFECASSLEICCDCSNVQE